MFLIDCFLYESNTSCTSSYRSYFYSIMYTGKSRMILHFINAGQRYNCWYWLKTHMCWFFLIRRYSQFPCLSFFVQASGEHESNRTIYNSLRWENWIVWHCLEFTVWLESIWSCIRWATCCFYKFEKSSLTEFRWSLFSLQQNKYSKSGCHQQETLMPAVRRANFQSLIWAENDKPYPVKPSLQGYGWSTEGSQLIRVKCKICSPIMCIRILDRASKADVGCHVDVCQITFRAQRCVRA